MTKKRYPKGSAWKRSHWDKWTVPRKILHIIQVILALIAVLVMLLVVGYIANMAFEIQSSLTEIQNAFLRDIIELIFGPM